MAVLQPLIDLAEVCYAQGIRHVVISPGSRSAALTLAFSRHRGFEKHVVMDERSAGFIALGMAQQLKQTVILICTSGSAAYNYAPAVTEAFFQQISLLILTADRPQEWIHQLDGQTIYQAEIYGKHVKKSFTIPSDYGHKDARWLINRTTNEAAILAYSQPYGPVHINVPIREPFYPENEEELSPSADVRVIKKVETEATLSVETWHELLNEWDDAERILIAGGQHENSEKLNIVLSKITEELDVPVVGDSISNQKGNQSFITFQDLFLADADTGKLQPDLLITYGLSFISKAFKQFLQKNPSIRHWHISEDSHIVDTFFSLTQIIPVSPEYFFNNTFEKIDYQLFVQGSDPENDSSYKTSWTGYDLKAKALSAEYLKNLSVLNDLTSVNSIINSLPEGSQLHIANSMPIRYVNALGSGVSHLEIFANRGTSGIDGCVSTAIGAALVNNKPTFLLVGDVAFLYDRNGLLIQPLPGNLKIIVLNNSGGNIFRMIDGPASLPELENYFETRHPFTAKRTSEDSKIEYFQATDFDGLKTELSAFLDTDKISLLEVFTDPAENAKSWKGLKSYIRSNW
ncbi:2-succinyl-5-enolpyruvyl-6-hydroxy-3-cyclohexene-1-carboxylic-acid synthase [Dyadobacter frigoris]|uniref:2-succinyl-5-enolpyruvyl-6-hydroxy-3-cyclohexene-1-carboxylate synthase n=1 Tax=Dyadobacter frigoris TaxID=2576211 RepID=A0A4U6CWI6_9BACT|nr:2-succinyl-5-enolpyruvyl-6-hydroxy-3-cyclohexene-1-carboxylic-acid synthase [Dyadobacter frigoris]TKT87538.1 2-succinyl-5-enolpyruvyl-6-hydroxy-3-cyclohexene-1-carboxylic-acid synthase [Dyadobacter frigoris]GLU52203.1 2-succinyl-5-enolpyruvyl-6-hydroxy-3-cyclohexene-1-carboxylate synthase [Dyadobacter frigoris]